MRIRTCIRRVARERGMTAAEVARRLKLYRSNLSAIDAGTRSLSLRALGRIAEVLACSPGELLEGVDAADRCVFGQSRLNARLAGRDAALVDGAERTWVHAALLAWQRHYRHRR
jgi:transcriptional regulator with XRE-family HTH domain